MTKSEANPLLLNEFFIPFDRITPEQVEPAVTTLLEASRAGMERLAEPVAERTYANTLQPLDSLTERLDRAMAVVRHLESVSTTPQLRAAYNANRKARGQEELDAMKVLSHIREKVKMLGLSDDMLSRSVNEGFSGGEKKRNEIFQMAVLEPTLCVLDETDSGLDIDALKTVADGVNALRSPSRSFVVVTHYQRLLNYIVPDFVHIMMGGRLVKSGGKELALELEEKGYGWLEQELAGA